MRNEEIKFVHEESPGRVISEFQGCLEIEAFRTWMPDCQVRFELRGPVILVTSDPEWRLSSYATHAGMHTDVVQFRVGWTQIKASDIDASYIDTVPCVVQLVQISQSEHRVVAKGNAR